MIQVPTVCVAIKLRSTVRISTLKTYLLCKEVPDIHGHWPGYWWTPVINSLKAVDAGYWMTVSSDAQQAFYTRREGTSYTLTLCIHLCLRCANCVVTASCLIAAKCKEKRRRKVFMVGSFQGYDHWWMLMAVKQQTNKGTLLLFYFTTMLNKWLRYVVLMQCIRSFMHSYAFSTGWAKSRKSLSLGGQWRRLGGQLPTQLTC